MSVYLLDREYYEMLSLEERRKHYKCKRYVTLDEIETWSETRKRLGKKLYTKFN